MNIKLQEILPQQDDPFANCKLDRKKYGEALKGILQAYPTGFVLAINNKWGTGKTTFIKMWEQDLKNNSYRTIYFNAWENDFDNNALVALMGELKSLSNSNSDAKYKKALKHAATLSKHAIPIFTKAIAARYLNITEFKDSISDISKGFTEIFENEVIEYSKKKKNIIEFKKSMSEFIADNIENKPIVFIIDELDRCRPNYAVSILEQIKHFFSVPNIVFVLSIDKEQLGYAIKGVYGNDNIDSNQYLKRFIDIEYSIPEPRSGIYYSYLYEYFDFASFFNSSERKNYRELSRDESEFLNIAALLFHESTVSLRQQEKIFAHSRLALRSFKKNEYVIPVIYLLLNYIKEIKPDLYIAIKNCKLSINDLQDGFLSIFKSKITTKNEHLLIYIEAYLIIYYNNYLNNIFQKNNKLLETIDGKSSLLFSCKTTNSTDNRFLEIIVNSNHRGNTGDLAIDFFIKKIDLAENIII